MFDTHSTETLLYARVFGVFFIASAVGQFISPNWIGAVVEDVRAHPGIQRVVGSLTFFLGAFVAATHSIWIDPPAIVMSSVGWFLAFEGVLLLTIMPALYRSQAFSMPPTGWLKYAVLLLGLYLALVGFFGRASLTEAF